MHSTHFLTHPQIDCHVQIHIGLEVFFIDHISKKKVATIVITRLNVGKVGKNKLHVQYVIVKLKEVFMQIAIGPFVQ